MADQPTPTVSGKDVERVVQRDYPVQQAPEVMAILGEYGGEDWHRETERVRLAALKLARGDIEALRAAIDQAMQDYRDVIAWAEYPSYMKTVSPSAETPAGERQQVIDADWQQYLEWLDAPKPDV